MAHKPIEVEGEIQPGAACILKSCRKKMTPNWDETPENEHPVMPGYITFGNNGTSRALMGYICECGNYASAKLLSS